jgi:hypothetical protein
MNPPRRGHGPGARPGGNGARPARGPDLWRPSGPLPDPETVSPSPEVTALVRSLGDPPLPGSAVVAGHYISAVVEKAAQVALALAASADLLVMASDDET